MANRSTRRTPALRAALEQVAQVYARLRHPTTDARPMAQRVSIAANDSRIFFAMVHTGDAVRALAFVVLWRDADVVLRAEVEQLIRREVCAAPAFRGDLQRAHGSGG
ncbi:MAG: hypothetical protein H7Z42_22385 [Roseiflexaceae bacterium]|nr:hypothetical protein [Roseiflexaceae bacterium]